MRLPYELLNYWLLASSIVPPSAAFVPLLPLKLWLTEMATMGENRDIWGYINGLFTHRKQVDNYCDQWLICLKRTGQTGSEWALLCKHNAQVVNNYETLIFGWMWHPVVTKCWLAFKRWRKCSQYVFAHVKSFSCMMSFLWLEIILKKKIIFWQHRDMLRSNKQTKNEINKGKNIGNAVCALKVLQCFRLD